MDNDDFFWFVGLCEGEATFLYPSPSGPNLPKIAIHMTDEDTIARAAKLMGVGYMSVKPRKAHWKLSYVTRIKGYPAVLLMEKMKPFMSRRRQAQITKAISDFKLSARSVALLYGPDHGTNSRYQSSKWNCRCQQCRTAHAAHRRAMKAAKKLAMAPSTTS